MTITADNPLEPLASAISALTIKDKRALIDIVEQQIFEEEEENYEESAETSAEVAAVRAEYEAGDYVTIEAYAASHALPIA